MRRVCEEEGLPAGHTLLSLSVGSIMSVPGTGHDIVGP